MAIQPLFNGPLFLPSRQLVSASSVDEATPVSENSVDVDTGPKAGNVLDKKDSDFTDPKTIQNITTRFSDSISPVTSNTLLVQLGVDPDPLGKNPDPIDILNGTLNAIDLINDPTLGANVRPRANSDPLRWVNPTALDIFVGVGATNGSLIRNPNVIVTPGTVIIPTVNGPVVVPTTGNANDTANNSSNASGNNSNTSTNPILIANMPINIWSNNQFFFPQQSLNQNNMNQNYWFSNAYTNTSSQPLTSAMYPLTLWMPMNQSASSPFANQYYSSIPQSYSSQNFSQPPGFTLYSQYSANTAVSGMYSYNQNAFPQIAYNLA